MLLRNGTEVKRQEEERKREREKSCTTYEVLCVVCLCFVNVKGVLIQTGERETESRINRTESTDLFPRALPVHVVPKLERETERETESETATENEADREIEREN